MTQIELVYDRLQSLSASTLIQVIDELELEFPNNKYREMSMDVYSKAKDGFPITHRQKRVLVNIIGQWNRGESHDN